MKKYIRLTILTGILIMAAIWIPNWIVAGIPVVEVTKVKEQSYSETVKATGEIRPIHQQDYILDYPVVPSQVNVSVGDWVEVGQVLALVDTEQTVSAMASIQKNIGNTDFSALLAGSSFDEKISDFPEQIIANATGTITSLSLQEGMLSSMGNAVVTIADSSQLQVKAFVNEDDVSQVQIGQQVKISGKSLGKQSYSGTVQKIYPATTTKTEGLSTQTGVQVEISIDNAPEDITLGSHVTATITTQPERTGMMLPYESVNQLDDGTEYVFCYQDGRAVMRPVKTGQETKNGIEILSGVSKEDWIIRSASSLQTNNCYVKLKEE